LNNRLGVRASRSGDETARCGVSVCRLGATFAFQLLGKLQHLHRLPPSDHRKQPSHPAQPGLRRVECCCGSLSLTSPMYSVARPRVSKVTAPFIGIVMWSTVIATDPARPLFRVAQALHMIVCIQMQQKWGAISTVKNAAPPGTFDCCVQVRLVPTAPQSSSVISQSCPVMACMPDPDSSINQRTKSDTGISNRDRSYPSTVSSRRHSLCSRGSVHRCPRRLAPDPCSQASSPSHSF
jgi:hypothetical protein